MSWLLIILLALLFLIVAGSCIAVVIWFAQGTPASGIASLNRINVLDRRATHAGQARGEPELVVRRHSHADPAALPGTGGKGSPDAAPGEVEAPQLRAARNRVEQTLYLDGKPALRRTAVVEPDVVLEQRGPMALLADRDSHPLVEWVRRAAADPGNRHLAVGAAWRRSPSEPEGEQHAEAKGKREFANFGDAFREAEAVAAAQAGVAAAALRLAVGGPAPAVTSWGDLSPAENARLDLAALKMEAARRQEASFLARRADAFHLTIAAVGAPSTSFLCLSVEVIVPAGAAAAACDYCWRIARRAAPGQQAQYSQQGQLPGERLLWQCAPAPLGALLCRDALAPPAPAGGPPVPVGPAEGGRHVARVLTDLPQDGAVRAGLLRLSLVELATRPACSAGTRPGRAEAEPAGPSGEVASVFFSPLAAIGKGLASLGAERAWAERAFGELV
jgi:hypothetical protein